MALSATFLADFASFTDACAKAEVSLKGFEGSSAKVETQLNRMVDSFSGRKVVQDAGLMVEAVDRVGGVSKLTEAELARVGAVAQDAALKLKAMGQDVPPGIQKIADATKQTGDETSLATGIVERFVAAFAVERVFEFAKGVIEAGARIEDLSLATGISAEGIQQLGYVGKEFGVDIEQMARGVEQLSAKLANGDKNATSAVQMLGLSVEGLLQTGPEEAFLTIADAAGRIENPMVKGGVAAELFGGKLAKVLLPMLSDLRGKLNEAAHSAAIMDDATTKSAHDFEVGFERMSLTAKAWFAEGLQGWKEQGEALLHFLGLLDHDATHSYANAGTSAAEMNRRLIEMANDQTAVLSTADLLQNKLTALRTAGMEPLSESQKDAIKELVSYGESQKDVAQLVGASEQAVHRYVEEVKAASIATKAANALQARDLEELTKLGALYTATRIKQSGDANAIEIAGINKWAADLAASFVKAHTDSKGFYDASTAEAVAFFAMLDKLTKQGVAAIGVDEQAIWAFSTAGLAQVAANAQKTFDAAVTASGGMSREGIEHFRRLRDAAFDHLHGLGDTAGETFRHMRDEVDHTSFTFRAWLMNAATDEEKAELGYDRLGRAIHKVGDETQRAMELTGKWYDLQGHKVTSVSSEITRDNYRTLGYGDYESLFEQGYSLVEATAIAAGGPKGPPKGPRVAGFEGGGGTGAGGLAFMHPDEYVVPKEGALVLRDRGAGGGGGTVIFQAGAVVLNNAFINDARSRAEVGALLRELLVEHALQVGGG